MSKESIAKLLDLITECSRLIVANQSYSALDVLTRMTAILEDEIKAL